jgi:hypothetical protein
MARSITSIASAIALTATLAFAGQAAADPAYGPGYTANDAPLGDAAEVKIELVGRVSARCEVSTASINMTGLRLGGEGSASGDFNIDCNAPFSLHVASERGGMASETPLPGVLALLPYELSVDVATDLGSQDLGWCSASAVAASPVGSCSFGQATGGWSSGDGVAIGKTGSLKLRWNGPGEGEGRLGDYADVITITLGVRS